MNFDMVFDIQHAYRKIVHAFAYPGEIVSLKEEADKLDLPLSCVKGMQVLFYMLLDADTSFHVVDDEELALTIARLTYCEQVKQTDAAHVIVTKKNLDHLTEVMNQIQIGTLEDPHLGATMLVECDDLYGGDEWTLSGPGIKDKKTISLPLQEEWVAKRKLVNEEFPLGFDMILVDANANCVALPRTTQIERG